MDHIRVFDDLKNSFGALWNYNLRGDTIEVITPYSTTNDMFISVFINERNGEFIASDGGWLYDDAYNTSIDLNDPCFSKLYYHYERYYDVKSVINDFGSTFFYKKTHNPKTIANIVYDLANFVSAIVSCSLVQFQDVAEKEEKEFFAREANAYISTLTNQLKVNHNYPIGNKLKNIRFSTIINHSSSKITLINYITGSNYNYFQSSIARANLNFEIASKSVYNQHIKNKIAFINDKADGFVQDKLYEYLNELESHTNTPNVKWSEKQSLQQYI
jgi:hypothetical protein